MYLCPVLYMFGGTYGKCQLSTGKLGIRIRYQGYGSRKVHVVVLCIPNSGFLSRIFLTQSVAVPSLSLFFLSFSLFLFSLNRALSFI